MQTLVGLWLPILVSSVLVFVASSLIWNVLGAHKWHVRGLPDEAAVRDALSKQSVPGTACTRCSITTAELWRRSG